MRIKEGKKYIMFKIATPEGVSFFDEHQSIIEKKGYVWFCQFGRINLYKDLIGQDGKIIFIKDWAKSGGKRYLLEYSEISETTPENGYPDYYRLIEKKPGLWFKVISISELPDKFEESFRVASTQKPIENVYKSMCKAFYIQAISNVTL